MTLCKMHTKQNHPLQFNFKFLNNSFPFMYIKTQTNIDCHCTPKNEYAFQGHCTRCWEWSQQDWIPLLHAVHKGTRPKEPTQMFVCLRQPLCQSYTELCKICRYVNTHFWQHSDLYVAETSPKAKHLMSQKYSQAPGRGQGILSLTFCAWFRC